MVRHGAAVLAALGVMSWSGDLHVRAATDTKEPPPYTVKDGKVDMHTYNGWRRYTESCMRCHGPDGAGSSYAPDLTLSLKTMSQQQFREVVVNGRTDVNTAAENVMPSFAFVKDVMFYLDDIYGYLKARSDGALGRGRPQRIGE